MSACVCKTKDKFQTTHFLICFSSWLPICLCVIITQHTKKYVSHSQGGVLHNTLDYILPHAATVPLYLPGVLAARRHSRCLVGSQTEHLKVNCRGKVSNVFSWAAKQMLRMITALLSVPHFGLFKGYKRYSIWARLARGSQKKRFLCRSSPCKREMVIRNHLSHAWRHSVAVFLLLCLLSSQPQTDSRGK